MTGTVKSIETMLRSIVIIVLTFKSYPIEACSSITYNEVDCPGKICDGGCCTMPNYTCCTNNLFCAKNINFCRDYSRGGESNHSSRKEESIYPSSFTVLIIYYYNHFWWSKWNVVFLMIQWIYKHNNINSDCITISNWYMTGFRIKWKSWSKAFL